MSNLFYCDWNIRFFHMRAGAHLGLFRVLLGKHKTTGWYFGLRWPIWFEEVRLGNVEDSKS